MNKFISLLLVCSLLSLSGCGYGIVKKEFYPKNPTSYVFNTNIDILRKNIPIYFSIENQINNPIKLNFLLMNVFNLSVNGKDFILDGIGKYWQSDIYLVDGNPAKMSGEFVVFLEEVTSNKTRIKISTSRLLVNFGGGMHGAGNYTKVKSTSVEEYAILLYIARFTGDKLPVIKKPK